MRMTRSPEPCSLTVGCVGEQTDHGDSVQTIQHVVRKRGHGYQEQGKYACNEAGIINSSFRTDHRCQYPTCLTGPIAVHRLNGNSSASSTNARLVEILLEKGMLQSIMN
jgi:hypothetical protein